MVKHFSDFGGRLAPYKFILLMIRKGEPRYAITKYLPGIFVLSNRAKVKYPIILAVTMVKKALGSFSWITVNGLDSRSREAHDNEMISYVDKV